jgi:hypothetical protein
MMTRDSFSRLGSLFASPREPGALAGTGVQLPSTQSRAAFHELLDLLRQLDTRYLGPEWNNQDHVPEGHRCVMQALFTALAVVFDADPERPVFQRSVGPTMKHTGDNADALYYVAYIRPDRSYRIRGNTAGAVYTSISLERGSDGHRSHGVARVINDRELHAARDGSYELVLSPEPRLGNWFKLEPQVGQLQTRHYFEETHPVAADPTKVVPLSIEPLDDPGPRPAPNDAAVAAGIRRVINYVHDITMGMPPLLQPERMPRWVSTVPNQFNPPDKPAADLGQSAQDAAYAQAPYLLKPDEVLVIEGRFPKCAYASVALWNHYLQTYDYVTRITSRNRKQSTLEPDGSFRMVIAHRDPGVPNWLDTEGRSEGLIFWRFFLPEEPIAPFKTRVLRLSELARR